MDENPYEAPAADPDDIASLGDDDDTDLSQTTAITLVLVTLAIFGLALSFLA